jgi:hypothetical protein
MNQSFKKLAHVFPAFFTSSVKNSWEKERHFVKDLVLSAYQIDDLMVHELQVNFHQFIRHGIRLIIGKKLGNHFKS